MRLAYDGAADCPDEAAFLAAVKAQARPFERAPRSAARVRSLEIAIARDGDVYTGVLRVREADGATSERDVRADDATDPASETCAGVFSALALVTALTIDSGPPPPKPPPAEVLPPPDPPPAPGRPWRAGAIAEGGAFVSMAPGPAFGGGASFELLPPLDGAPIALRLGVVAAASVRADTSTGSADFQWFAARLGVGLFSLSIGPVTARPTVGLDAGIARGVGSEIAVEREKIRAWFDVSAGLRLQLRATPWLDVELAGGVLVPITRDRWVFDTPEVVLHETPAAGGYATFGLRFAVAR